MDQNYQTTKIAGAGANVGPGYPPNASWTNPSGVTGVGTAAGLGLFAGGQHADSLVASSFGISLPPHAVVDGISVYVNGSQTGVYGDVTLNLAGTTYKDLGALPNTYGSSTDLWGASEIDPAALSTMTVSIGASDVSGGDGIASVSGVTVTIYWHIEIEPAPFDVPTRVDYKVYSRNGNYLGLLPKVTSKFGFPQEMNSPGATIDIECGVRAENILETEAIITGDGDDIITGLGEPLLATTGTIMLARGADEQEAIFKNSNRIQVWMYNYWYPNGKLMFSGQVNKVRPKFAGGKSSTKLTVLSDGLDLNNFIARGYPFNYTNDVSQTTENTYVTSSVSGPKGGGWNVYGQSFVVGGAVSNIGAISLLLRGTANVTVSLYSAPNGNLLGTTSKSVNNAIGTLTQFEFPQLVDVTPGGLYFFAVWVDQGQAIDIFKSSSNVYTDGTSYNSNYSGGSGGGSFSVETGDLYFITKSGTPTTTATYSTQDPITGMFASILTDYNNRGGYVRQRNFVATGLSLTYTFIMAYILDALKKALDMSPAGYTAYIDYGTAEMDIFPISETADFTVVNGRDVIDVDLELDITGVKNYLLLTGGEVTPGVNLYRDYPDTESMTDYGIRTATKSDNRMTVTATANAVGDSFIEENSDEAENAALIVPVTAMDHTLLTPGKTIGFKGYGNFMDDIIAPIVRREFNTKYVVLTLGRMPVRMNDEIQRINRELLNEQTANNPTAPS